MKVAVTGANGFVGTHICNFLTEQGFQVNRISRSEKRGFININQIDSSTNWEYALKDVEIVIHCASKLDGPKFKEKKNEFNKINYLGTKRLAEESLKAGVKRFIYLSSIKVNGELSSKNIPFTANSEPNPKGEYALSKYQAENEIRFICEKSEMEYVLIRSTLIYGPGVRGNFLNLLKLISIGVPLPFVSIRNKRSILYIGNLINFINSCIDNPLAKNKLFLLADNTPLSTPELIKEISKALNLKANLWNFPICLLNLIATITGKSDQLKKLKGSLEVNSEESYNLLNIKPFFTTSEGLKITANWFKSK